MAYYKKGRNSSQSDTHFLNRKLDLLRKRSTHRLPRSDYGVPHLPLGCWQLKAATKADDFVVLATPGSFLMFHGFLQDWSTTFK